MNSTAIIPVLPSAASAMALVNGEPGALPTVVAHTVLRAGIIGFGLYVAGHRERLGRTALVSSLAIEAFVLGWATYLKTSAGGGSASPAGPLR